MYLSTFKEEEIINQSDLILKSLFILAFLTPNEDTNTRIRFSEDRKFLESVRYSPALSKYTFISMVNPPGYNLVAKNLPDPRHRQAIEEDFFFIEEHTLHEYLKLINVISATFGLN